MVTIKVFFTNRVVSKKENQTTSKEETKGVSQKSLKEPGKIKSDQNTHFSKRWKEKLF